MSKRLIMVLALAFVFGIAFAAYAEVQNVKVSGDLSVMAAGRDLSLRGPKNGNDTSFLASIARLRLDSDLTDNVAATVRLLNERYWGRDVTDNPDVTSANTDVALDLAYATLNEFLNSPLTLMVGRQELHYGSEMIVGDPDTNGLASTASAFGSTGDFDLSARKAFDAIRAVLNYDPLVIDAVMAKVSANNSNTVANDDTNLYGVNATYTVNANTSLEAYWFLKTIGKEADASNDPQKSDDTNTIGARIVTKPLAKDENLTTSLEMAYQFGHYVDSSGSAPRKAWALEAAATYAMPSVKMTPAVTALYSYFSGQNSEYDTTHGTYRAWNPMYENQKSGDIVNALFAPGNAHILGGIATAKPKDDVTLKGEYYAYWWAKPYVDGDTATTLRSNSLTMTERSFVGQELDLTAIYDYTEDVQFCLMGGWFVPGPSIAKERSTVRQDKVATEVIGSMKISF